MFKSAYTLHLVGYYVTAIIATLGVAVSATLIFRKTAKSGTLINHMIKASPYILAAGYFLFFWYADTILSIRSQIYTNIITNIFNGITSGTYLFTVNDFNVPMHIFGYYFAPVWIPLAYISKIFNNSPLFLHGLESAVLAFGAVPIMKFSNEKFKNNAITIAFTLSYLLSFFIQTANMWSVEVRTMSTAVISWALYFLFKDRRLWFLAMIALFLLCGTPNAALIIFLGLYIIFVKKDRGLGIVVFLAGTAYFIAGVKVSSFVNHGVNLYARQFDAVRAMVLDPFQLFKFIFNPKHLLIVLLILLPLGFFSLLELPLFLTVLPSLYMNFTIFNDVITVLFACYSIANLVPVVIFSAMLGLYKLQKFKNVLGLYLLLVVLVEYLFFTPFSYQGLYWPGRFDGISKSDLSIKNMLSDIPKDATVSADNRYRMALANRREIYMVSGQKKATDYIVISHYAEFPVLERAKELLKEDEYGVWAYTDGVVVFKKGHKKRLADYIKTDFSDIKNQAYINFSNKIALRGFNLDKDYYKRGDECELTLFWEVLDDIKEDIWFIIRLSKYGRTYGEAVYIPYYGFYPTSLWKKGDRLKDSINIKIPKDTLLSRDPLLLEIWPVSPLYAESSGFSERLLFLQSVKDKKEKLNDNVFGLLQLVR